MASNPRLTVRALRARAVEAPMEPPVETSGGTVDVAPLVLIDLETEEGVTGRSYLFCYTPLALEPVRQLVLSLEGLIEDNAAAPLEIQRKLQRTFLLLRPQGFTGMAMAGIDMAAWDALAKACDMPLVEFLGGEARPIPAYGSLRTMGRDSAPQEARELAELGFGTFKVKIGRTEMEADLEVVRAIREVVGEDVKLAVDYNQFLSVTEAVERVRVLGERDLYWIEEPTRADDFSGHARIRREAKTPICIGESWWGTGDMAKSFEAGASDHCMPDVMRIGGVSGWLNAAALAEATGLPLSSHTFPEISAHLLAVSPTGHLLEYLDVASPILKEPLKIEDGRAIIPSRSGIGLEWDEDAVSQFLVR